MIKKNTKAIFVNGDYKGEYDWRGGIPLSEGETMSVKINKEVLQYKLIKKEISYNTNREDQLIDILYTFELL